MNRPDTPHPLITLASLLAGSTDIDEVLAVILDEGTSHAGADCCVLGLPSDSTTRLELISETAGSVAETVLLPLDADTPLSEAVRTGAPVITSSEPEPGRPRGVFGGFTTWAALPLDANSGTSGGIAFGWRLEHPLDAEALAELEHLARWAGIAVERARYRRREQRLVAAIRGELLGPLNTGPSFEAVGAYRSPWSGVPIGGDWYDGFTLPGGTVVVVIGDVAGHGIEAAPTMLTVRDLVRAFASEDPAPAAVLTRLDRAFGVFGLDAGMATVLVAAFDPERGTLEWANGGLPPPLLRRADGRVTTLTTGRTQPVGTDRRVRTGSTATVELRPSDTVVMHTDGLLTPPEAGGVEMADITAAVEAHGSEPLSTLVETLLSLGSHGRLHTDDASVLAARVPIADGPGV